MESAYPVGVASLLPEIEKQLAEIKTKNILERFRQRDVMLWSQDESAHDEIAHRLDWLDAPAKSVGIVVEAESLKKDLLDEGYTHAVVLGMGGSSLAPEVYSLFLQRFAPEKQQLYVSIIDSTSPDQIMAAEKGLPLDKTLFIVSSKSGTTVEVKTLLAYFWQKVEEIAKDRTGDHFVAISDPGSQLLKAAAEKKFRKTFEANPDVGGRYSAMIAFGLVPAIMNGYDGHELLKSAAALVGMDEANEGVKLGIVLATAYHGGRDKLTILADEAISPLGSWIEQLIAESSGKNGKGILPIDQEPVLLVNQYKNDRVFIYLRIDGKHDKLVQELISEGQPVYQFEINDIYAIARLFYAWETATAIACILLGVNAFDQPNVQESKSIANKMLEVLKAGKAIETHPAVFENETIAVFSKDLKKDSGKHVSQYINSFFRLGKAGGFVAVNAFVARSKENEKGLVVFRKVIAEITGLPTTLGFGPRFLHSTGQLHKGGKDNGLFIVISQVEEKEIDIPGEGISFNDLILAQALGDTQALESHQRRVLRLHFPKGAFASTNLIDLLI